MNKLERKIYDKYAYDKKFEYIWKVYTEFERRVNATSEDYEGLKFGECRFDYESWETRLNISHRQMTRAIKELKLTDKVITQIFKGIKGNSSIYFLNRFEQFEEQKKEQKQEQKQEQNKASKIQALDTFEEQKQEQKQEQKTVHTSKNTNLRIKSNIYNEQQVTQNTILIEQVNSIWNMYPKKRGKAKAYKKLPTIIKKYSYEQIVRVVNRYSEEVKDKELQFIKQGDTFFNGGFEDYLDKNYEVLKTNEPVKAQGNNIITNDILKISKV